MHTFAIIMAISVITAGKLKACDHAQIQVTNRCLKTEQLQRPWIIHILTMTRNWSFARAFYTEKLSNLSFFHRVCRYYGHVLIQNRVGAYHSHNYTILHTNYMQWNYLKPA